MSTSSDSRRRILLIGWDAADWKLLQPLMDAGRMPHLAALVREGCRGPLASIRPVLSPIVWTSIATGKRPHKHGVLGFVRADPVRGTVRAAARGLWRARPVWDILREQGWKTQVTGWYASHPPGPGDGCGVSDQFAVPGPDPDNWPLPAGAVFPPELANDLRKLRVHPAEMGAEELKAFIPAIAKGWKPEPAAQPLLESLARALSETASVHAAATWLMEHREWDFSAVYYRLLDECGHHFMPFRPPLRDGIEPRDAALFGGVMDAVCGFLDAMLGRLLALAGPETTVMLVSDHGFQSAGLRPSGRADRPEDMAGWHRLIGMVALRGQGIRRGEGIFGSSVLDIAPTILHLCGLPAGEDMDGKVWLNALTEPNEVKRLPTWEPEEPAAEMASADLNVESAMLEHLADLGYLDTSVPDKIFVTAAAEWRFNLVAALTDAGMLRRAEDEARELHLDHPDEARYHQIYAEAVARRGRFAEAAEIAGSCVARHGPDVWSHVLFAAIFTETGCTGDALRELAAAAALCPENPAILDRCGRIYLRQRRWRDAENSFRAALRIEPENPVACTGLARALIRQNASDEALEWALTAVGLQHVFPAGHFQLGAILSRRGDEKNALLAFKTCIAQQPVHRMAHKYLSMLYFRAGEPALAALHRACADRLAAAAAAAGVPA